jgi:hypothetical protein
MHHANASRPRQNASHRVTAELLPTVSGVCNERSEAVDQGPKTQVGRKCDIPSPEKSLNEDQSRTGNDAREEIERDKESLLFFLSAPRNPSLANLIAETSPVRGCAKMSSGIQSVYVEHPRRGGYA